MKSQKLDVKGALMAAAAALASAMRPGRALPIARDGRMRASALDRVRGHHASTPGAFGRGKYHHNPAGTKLGKQVGRLTARHPVGTHY